MNLDAGRSFRRLSRTLVAAWLLLGAVYVFYGCYVGDEGWYCLIAREVWKGRALYSDIRFTQTPLLPYLYGAFLQFLPARIESGRVISLVLGFAGVLLLYRMLRERYDDRSTIAALLLTLLSTTFIYDLASVRTQALSFCLSTACLFFCHCATRCETGAAGRRAYLLACLCAGLAVTARLSFLPLCFVPAFLALMRRRNAPSPWLLLGQALLAPLSIGVYYLAVAGDRFLFGIFNFHVWFGRSMKVLPPGALANAASNLLLFTIHTLPWMAALAAAICYALAQWRRELDAKRTLENNAFEVAVVVAWALITLIHITRRPAYPTYQTPLAWAPAIAVAWALGRWMRLSPPALQMRRFGLAVSWIGVLSASLWSWQDSGLIFDRARTPAGIYDLAAPLRHATGKTIVTFEAGLPFCAPQIRLPPGCEMAEFSLVPPLPAARQEYFRGTSFRRLQADVEAADFIALRPMDFSHLHFSDPAVTRRDWDALFAPFAPILTVSSYGQYGTRFVLRRRHLPPQHLARSG